MLRPPMQTAQSSAMAENVIQQSVEDVWYLKTIEFGEGDARRHRKIITQNFNGYDIFLGLLCSG
jgi:ubiquitin carboxyl-terminal hydrolase MINDY-1/2